LKVIIILSSICLGWIFSSFFPMKSKTTTVNHMIILLHIKFMVHYFSLETKAQIKPFFWLPNVYLLNNGVCTWAFYKFSMGCH
jgi:hypothetical protein